eukprot:m.170593 g.170593  ORF g.170593 m.170593 type:complete len:58 (-) comp31615_c0_seq3:364-537(-)
MQIPPVFSNTGTELAFMLDHSKEKAQHGSKPLLQQQLHHNAGPTIYDQANIQDVRKA